MSFSAAQIKFIDDHVSLVHIPLDQYRECLQPLMQVLWPVPAGGSTGGDIADLIDRSLDVDAPWANKHPFLNVSITPTECSIVCSKSLALTYFAPVLDRINSGRPPGKVKASISAEDFVVFSVGGAGLEADRRVLDLTSPLAMAGISIFFITTYFSDYILVPTRCRSQVIEALQSRGFQFENVAENFMGGMTKINGNGHHHHRRHPSSGSSLGTLSSERSPPSSLPELQARTMDLLKQHNISPKVDRSMHLVQCAGRRDNPGRFAPADAELQIGLIQCLVHQPRFLSLTLTDLEAPSILMQHSALANFRSQQVLLGNQDVFLIPIVLNLELLPSEMPGIVCGLAGKLVGDHKSQRSEVVEMSYLSTARAGTIMVEERYLEGALRALREGEVGFDVI
ncbi:hypothetical protein MMC25_006223 [Agyrium rufum]|nr:hypothetical protein [Agyrium rufum]